MVAPATVERFDRQASFDDGFFADQGRGLTPWAGWFDHVSGGAVYRRAHRNFYGNLCMNAGTNWARWRRQREGLVAVLETGLMWANMLRAFQVGKALTSDGRPSSSMRPSRVAWAQVSCPACHLTKASASAVM